MLDYMTAYNYVSRDISAFRIIIATLKSQPALKVDRSPTMAGVKSVTVVTGTFVLDQLSQEETIAATNVHDVAVFYLPLDDHVVHKLVDVLSKGGRMGLRVFVVGAVHDLFNVEGAVADEATILTDCQGKIATWYSHG